MRGRILDLLFLFCAGCGRVGFDASADGGMTDTGGDTSGAPCTFSSWSAPVALAELNTLNQDSSAQISADGLTLYYSANEALAVARRTMRGATWGAPQIITELDSPGPDDDPSVSPDELEIYFDHTDASNFMCLYRSERPTTAVPWAAPTQMTSFCSGVQAGGPYLTPDGLTLLYTQEAINAIEGTLMISTRATRADAFAPGTPVDISPGMLIGYPALSADQLTIYFEGDNGQLDIFEATRPAIGSPFGNITPLPVNSPQANDEDASITADGLELYFDSNRATLTPDQDLFVSTRTCL